MAKDKDKPLGETKFLKKYAAFTLLVIDEWLLDPPDEGMRGMLLELLKRRYDTASTGTNTLYRTVCRWWAEIEVLIVTGATTAKVEANNTAIQHMKRTARGCRNPGNYKSRIVFRSAARMAA